MLHSEKALKQYSLQATDGTIGKVHGFFFDDRNWVIRYLVADTGTLLAGRRVLLFPIALAKPDWERQAIPVGLSRQRIENSPPTDTDKPVSAQHEIELHEYFQWMPYWTTSGGPYGTVVPPMHLPSREEGLKSDSTGDPHLRSTREVEGYRIHAVDGEIGHVEDFIIDGEKWKIRYFVVDTRNWLPGRKVLVSPQWIDRISWSEAAVSVDLTRDAVKASPEYDPTAPVNRKYELRLYDYYGRPKYF